MIQIEDLHVVEFRGIRDLQLWFDGKSYAIWGPNGSGKSGVVDALDFALTGDVSRLRGAGSGAVTLAKHGPHVHRRDDPGSAYVEVTVRDPLSGDVAKLKRTLKTPTTFTLEPDLVSVRRALSRAEQHPELILSRREIIKYIVAEPGRRSAEVQALLKLERLGEVRSALRSAKSKITSALKAADGMVVGAQQALERHLDLPSLFEGEVLASINARRTILGLEPLARLDDGTDFSTGVDRDVATRAFNKNSAIRDFQAVADNTRAPTRITQATVPLQNALVSLDDDPEILDSLKTRSLVKAGLDQLVDERCPLCDVSWKTVNALRDHLERKVQRSDDAARLQTDILDKARSIAAELRSTAQLVEQLRPLPKLLRLRHDVAAAIEEWLENIAIRVQVLSTLEGIQAAMPGLESNPACEPDGLRGRLEELYEAIEAAPDQTATAEARAFLTIAQERWSALRAARAKARKASSANDAAGAIYMSYCEAQDGRLAALYQTVQERFSEFYRAINADDEADFKASLEPKAQKLDLLVDFYGIGMFPPVAYHSEGHQDGMGVCLYLAMMENLLGDDFRLAILDDVVMSVDINHRRQFCSVLMEYFPNVQFVITTHDEVWANQMQKSGLISKTQQAQFLNWSVETGPMVMEGEDFWDRIGEDLERNDVPAAAARLRRNLEAALADIAEQLGGMVPYRSVGKWDLGEYMNAVKGRYSKLLRTAAKAADSWNNDDMKAAVQQAKDEWAVAELVQSSEQWAVNPAVHYNSWANFSKADFAPVVDASRQFLNIFRCSACDSQIHLSTTNGREESLRCPCGAVNFGLLAR